MITSFKNGANEPIFWYFIKNLILPKISLKTWLHSADEMFHFDFPVSWLWTYHDGQTILELLVPLYDFTTLNIWIKKRTKLLWWKTKQNKNNQTNKQTNKQTKTNQKTSKQTNKQRFNNVYWYILCIIFFVRWLYWFSGTLLLFFFKVFRKKNTWHERTHLLDISAICI